MSERTIILELATLEAAHVAGLVEQFVEVLGQSGVDQPLDDPAVARLVPDAYRDDADAAREFRDLTQQDLFGRRVSDADVVLATLRVNGRDLRPDTIDRAEAEEMLTVSLSLGEATAWLKTLAAIRLVLAGRLGVVDEDDHDEADPRFGIYDWLGFRLDGLVQALDAGSTASSA